MPRDVDSSLVSMSKPALNTARRALATEKASQTDTLKYTLEAFRVSMSMNSDTRGIDVSLFSQTEPRPLSEKEVMEADRKRAIVKKEWLEASRKDRLIVVDNGDEVVLLHPKGRDSQSLVAQGQSWNDVEAQSWKFYDDALERQSIRRRLGVRYRLRQSFSEGASLDTGDEHDAEVVSFPTNRGRSRGLFRRHGDSRRGRLTANPGWTLSSEREELPATFELHQASGKYRFSGNVSWIAYEVAYGVKPEDKDVYMQLKWEDAKPRRDGDMLILRGTLYRYAVTDRKSVKDTITNNATPVPADADTVHLLSPMTSTLRASRASTTDSYWEPSAQEVTELV